MSLSGREPVNQYSGAVTVSSVAMSAEPRRAAAGIDPAEQRDQREHAERAGDGRHDRRGRAPPTRSRGGRPLAIRMKSG